jgi:hypothetical protein
MAETCRDIYDNKSQLLHQFGTSRHLYIYIHISSHYEALVNNRHLFLPNEYLKIASKIPNIKHLKDKAIPLQAWTGP